MGPNKPGDPVLKSLSKSFEPREGKIGRRYR
jgi:hypothetical protein